jgi:hypothetical protein
VRGATGDVMGVVTQNVTTLIAGADAPLLESMTPLIVLDCFIHFLVGGSNISVVLTVSCARMYLQAASAQLRAHFGAAEGGATARLLCAGYLIAFIYGWQMTRALSHYNFSTSCCCVPMICLKLIRKCVVVHARPSHNAFDDILIILI